MTPKQFSIAHYTIDVSRSTISSPTESVSVEPKVMQVLVLLAQNQDEVVTHQTIMASVWQGVEVVPNALQRCIAQLRKALGDDGKKQAIIATHPRIGYSLVAKVNWHNDKSKKVNHPINENDNNALGTNQLNKSTKIDKTSVTKWLLLFGIISSLLFLLALNWQTLPTTKYTKIAAITQSDQHESNPIYSNDGQYIIFNRHVDICTGNLWAKHTKTGNEIKLTEETSIYGQHSFNSDGSQLIFSVKAHCQAPQPAKTSCWNIATIDFADALTSAKKPKLRFECQAELLETPKALSNNQYAYLQRKNGRYNLMHFDDRTKQTKTLYNSNERDIYYFDYDAVNQKFAVISRDNDKNILDILAQNGEVIDSNVIQRLPSMSYYQYFEANFIPSGEYLLTSTHTGPHLLTLDGTLSPIIVPERQISAVSKHPNNDTLLAIRGSFDYDIAELSISQQQSQWVTETSSAFNQQYLPFPSLSRTTSAETIAKYQPEGSYIAFVSDRSGSEQLWLWRQQQIKQLTFNNNSRNIDNFVWAPNGEQLAYVLNDKITLVTLNGNTRQLNTKLPIFSVLNWIDNNQLLVTANTNKVRNLYRYDLNSQQLVDLKLSQVKQAWVYQDMLIYVNKRNQAWQTKLSDITNNNARIANIFCKSCLVNDGSLYHVDPTTHILFKYNLITQQQQPLITLKDKAWWIKDIKAEKLLISQAIAVKKAVIELSR